MHSKILDSIFRHAEHKQEKVAIYSVDGTPYSYAAVAERIVSAAHYLRSLGLKKGDTIMLSAQKDVEFVWLYFGAHLCGIINVVVDAKNNREHLQYIAAAVHPSAAFGMDLSDINSDLYSSIKPFGFSDIEIPHCDIKFCATDPDEVKDSDTADIMFTSGTTGNPKGVRLTYANIYGSASNINAFIGNTSEDVELLGLPICHSFGLGRLRCNILTGATIVLHNGFANLKSVFAAFEKYGITGFGMVPAVWVYIKRFSGTRISKYANQIRYIEIGSAAMPIEDKRLLMELFPHTRICMHYGLTEASRSLFMEFHTDADTLDSAGRAVSKEVEVKILNDQGEEVPRDTEGEICIRGNMVTSGYLNSEDNANAFWGDFFRTGDWGSMDAAGGVYLKSRKKELINVGGKKVSPVEIEEALSRAGVGESMCVGIPDPDGVLGEVPKALLVKDTFDKAIDEIKKELTQYLESYKLPKAYEIVDSIPKTSSGKKKRLF